MKINTGSAFKTISAIKVQTGTGLKSVTRAKVNVGGVLKNAGTFYTLPSLSLSTSSVTVSRPNPTVQSEIITATVSGGIAPFTYAWTRLTGSGYAVSPTSASSRLANDFLDYGTTTGTFRCTVTDALSNTAYADVSASFTYFDGSI